MSCTKLSQQAVHCSRKLRGRLCTFTGLKYVIGSRLLHTRQLNNGALQMPLTYLNSDGFLLQDTYSVVAAILLLQHHGVLSWQLGTLADACSSALASSSACAAALPVKH